MSFQRCLTESKVSPGRRSPGGRLFHSWGPAAEKLLSPSLLCVRGTSSFRMLLELDHSGRQPTSNSSFEDENFWKDDILQVIALIRVMNNIMPHKNWHESSVIFTTTTPIQWPLFQDNQSAPLLLPTRTPHRSIIQARCSSGCPTNSVKALKATTIFKKNTMSKPRFTCRHTHCVTTLYPGLPGWSGTRRNIHPLTPVLIIRHPLSTSSIYYDP